MAEEKGLERDGDLSEEIEEGEIKDDDANPDAAAAAARAGAEQPHPLEHSWTFWYDNPQSKSKHAVWGSSLRRIHTFSTVEDFWGLYNNINHPSKLIVGADFHCFKDNIEPKWEDPVCANGGKWTISCARGRSDQMWLYTLLAMIGEQFDYGDEICGAVVSVRMKQEKIALWTKNAANEKAQISIGKQWKELLDYNDNIHFLVHDDAMKLDKLAKNRYTLSRRFYASSSNPSRRVRLFRFTCHRCAALHRRSGFWNPAPTGYKSAASSDPFTVSKATLLTIRGHLCGSFHVSQPRRTNRGPKRASTGPRDSSSAAADPETKPNRPWHRILGTLVLIPWRCLENEGILQEAEWIHRALIPLISNHEKMVKKKLVREEGDNECSSKNKLSSCSSAPHFPCHPRPVHPSFLKIMIGDFQDFLFIPPDFTKVMVDLVDKDVYLKTSLGSRFKVKLTTVDKSLAFKDGWPDFVLDHSVASGEVLVFTYVSKSFFAVEIFGIDTCERVYFGKTDGKNLNGKKKEKADTSFRRPQLVKGQKSFEASSFKKDSQEKTDPPSTDKNVSKCLGGTEVHFGKMSDNLCSRKKRRKAESSLERPQLIKKPHFFEASNAKKRSEAINDPAVSVNCIAESLVQNNNESGNSGQGIEMMDDPDYGCVAKNPDKGEKKPEFPPPHSCGSGSPRDVDVIQIARPSANMIRGEVPTEDEESGHSFVLEINNKQLSSCQDVILVTPEVDVLFPSGTTEMYHLGENEYDRLHEHNVMNAIAADETVRRFFLTEDGVCHIVEDNIENGQCKTNIIVEYHAGEKGNGIGGKNTIAAGEVVCKFLITEDGICHIVSEDITHGQVTATNTNVAGNSMGCMDTVNMPRDASPNHESSPIVNSLAPVIQHINDQRANRILVHKKSRTGCSYIKRLPSSLDSLGGNHQDMPCMTAEANQSDNNLQEIPDKTATANQTGKASDILLEVNGEEDDSCLGSSHDPKSAEAKPTDLDGVFSLSSPCFSLTLSANYQFYIELPHSLQLPKGKKGTETKIVILRDSCLRLWPVMYRETDRFTGFVAGWNDFVKANNLQQGCQCNIFSIGNKYELLYHVQITQQ